MKISSKFLNVQSLLGFKATLKQPENFRILFHTPYGFVTASDIIFLPEDANPKTFDEYKEYDPSGLLFATGIKESILKENEYDLIGDGSLLVLKDVKIYKDLNSEPTLTISTFSMHADAVLGFSLIPTQL